MGLVGFPLFYTFVLLVADLQLGFRHALPLVPFMVLWMGWAASYVRKSPKWLFVGVVCMAIEFFAVYPNFLEFFNMAVGGPKNGSNYIVDSNLDWGQDLKALKLWMDDNGVGHINLSYFGTAKPEYYGINCTHLRGSSAVFTAAGKEGEKPKLPGLVAISVTNLFQNHYAYYSGLREMQPIAKINNTIFIYDVDPRRWQKN